MISIKYDHVIVYQRLLRSQRSRPNLWFDIEELSEWWHKVERHKYGDLPQHVHQYQLSNITVSIYNNIKTKQWHLIPELPRYVEHDGNDEKKKDAPLSSTISTTTTPSSIPPLEQAWHDAALPPQLMTLPISAQSASEIATAAERDALIRKVRTTSAYLIRIS
jgi:hypothetical protein